MKMKSLPLGKYLNKKIITTVLSAIMLTVGLLAGQLVRAGGGGVDPCADSVPNAYFSFSPTNKALGTLDATLDGSQSVACDSPIVSYDWDLGDGNSASDQTVSHQYQVGEFIPSLTITDAEGLTHTYYYYTSIIVKADNQDPVAQGATVSVLQGETVTVDLSGTASDPDGDDLSYGYFLPGDPDYGSSHNTDQGHVYRYSSAGMFNYSAAMNAVDSDSFEIGVRDGFGGVGIATVTVNIEPQLVAVDDYATATAGEPVTVSVLSNDYSSEGLDFDVNFYWGSNHGTLQLNPDDTFTFTPYSWFEGTAEFSYEIRSTAGVEYTSRANVYVEVSQPPNSPPVANDDSMVTDEDTVVSHNILINDSDADGDAFSALIVDGPINGAATLDGNYLHYSPSSNFFGSDSMTYQITDSEGNVSGLATVSITVSSVNDLPEANNDSAEVDEDGVVNVNILANDADLEDGSNLSVQILSGPRNGFATVSSGSMITYTPAVNYYGSDSFEYQVTDSDGGTATASVSINVNSVNDDPVATYSYSISKNGHAIFDASGSSDLDGQIVSYHWSFGDGQSATTSGPTTSHRYKGKGTFLVVLTVTDNEGASATFDTSISR